MAYGANTSPGADCNTWCTNAASLHMTSAFFYSSIDKIVLKMVEYNIGK